MATTMTFEVGRSAETPSFAVVEAVAAEEGIDPVELRRPLHEVIDPDALDRLVDSYADRPGAVPFEVSFSYYGHAVTVSSGGTVRVDGEAASRSP